MGTLNLVHRFDPGRKRHYLNDQLVVLHCHHYATLFSQLAFDAKDLADGPRILKETAEDIFFDLLKSTFERDGITSPAERLDIGRQMFSALGLGTLAVKAHSPGGGDIEMPNAHVDQGWLKKWGKADHAVNLIGAGFLAGMFAAAYGKPVRTFKIQETASMVAGAPKSTFTVAS
jgi:hypothetical protein